MDRRTFLGAGVAGMLASQNQWAQAFQDKRLKVGLIGAGWYGKCDTFRLLQVTNAEVIAIADPDKKMLDEAVTLIAARQKDLKAKPYEDYKQLLANEKCDIVVIGTPDHWHALTAIDAMKAGADVYVQKPISIDVLEGKAMLDAARKYKRVVQVGTQRRSTPHLIEAKEKVINAGLLGDIGQVDICCYYHMRFNEDAKPKPIPDFLNYNLWTGPAPLRQYDNLPHRRWWRTFMEYGNGIVGDMCIHMLDMVRWALDLGWPINVSSTGGIFVQKGGRSNITDTQTAIFNYDKFPVVWNHRTYGPPVDPEYPWAAIIHGSKGTLKMSVNKYEFFPAGKSKATISGTALIETGKYPEDKTEKDLEQHVASAIRGHMRDFLKAIADRSKPIADIEQGHISTATCHLANLSQKLGGRTLSWNPEKHVVTGDDEATKLLKRPYREGWTHPSEAQG
jgi:predicted dehydrogenase